MQVLDSSMIENLHNIKKSQNYIIMKEQPVSITVTPDQVLKNLNIDLFEIFKKQITRRYGKDFIFTNHDGLYHAKPTKEINQIDYDGNLLINAGELINNYYKKNNILITPADSHFLKAIRWKTGFNDPSVLEVLNISFDLFIKKRGIGINLWVKVIGIFYNSGILDCFDYPFGKTNSKSKHTLAVIEKLKKDLIK